MAIVKLFTILLNAVNFRFPGSINWPWDSVVLTPLQRWQAAQRFNSGFMTERWFVVTGVIVIVILTVLLIIVSYSRILQQRRESNELFKKYSRQRGLSEREQQILFDVTDKTGLRRNEAIFTMEKAFDNGVSKMVEENLSSQQSSGTIRQLKTELSFLREKLGFKKRAATSIGRMGRVGKLSSMQIPAGKKLQITRRKSGKSTNLECTVVENNDIELAVKLSMPVETVPGDMWLVRCYYGASVWEFEASVAGTTDELLFLNHSNNIRFVNRRRFLRVPVQKSALIAHFPFSKLLNDDENDPVAAVASGTGAPRFVPAVVTELAGPGLRIGARLELKVNDRVLVIFKLEEAKTVNAQAVNDAINPQRAGRAESSKMVEDIGIVRHIKRIENGFSSIAVELTGLSDSNISELIRVTNAASRRNAAKDKILEPAAIQEVA